ncbi:MAG: hypothetical protein AAF360_00605 [Pseudomonadota bacterium]
MKNIVSVFLIIFAVIAIVTNANAVSALLCPILDNSVGLQEGRTCRNVLRAIALD